MVAVDRFALVRRCLSLACSLPLLFAICACASMEPSAGASFVVVRHAEKVDDGSRDPALSARGRIRAQALAQQLGDAPLVAVYSTAFRRTQQTAQPAASMHRIPVTTYDASTPAVELAASLRARYSSGTVLVVGHSNTVPGIAAALCTCRVAALGEDDYDATMTVHIDPAGRALLDVGQQSPVSTPSPASELLE